MEMFLNGVDWLFRFGHDVLYGDLDNSATVRIIFIGALLGVVNILPLTAVVVLLAAFMWLYSLWEPDLRGASGFYFGMLMLLGCVLFSTWLARQIPLN